MKIHSIAPLRVMGAAFLALFMLIGTAPVSAAAPSVSAPARGKAGDVRADVPLPVLSMAAQSDCQNFEAKTPSIPYVEFCKPQYGGSINGPFGSHVVIAVGGFTAGGVQLKNIFLTSDPASTAKGCEALSTTCLPFSGSLNLNANPARFFVQFDWTFDPSMAKMTYYNAVLEFSQKGGKSTSQQVSQTTFDLTSLQAPCIFVSTDKSVPPDLTTACTSNSPLYAQSGDTLWITGTGWIASSSDGNPFPQTIDVWACQQNDKKCLDTPSDDAFSAQHIELPDQNLDESGQTNGVFQAKVTLKANTGMFTIVASNRLKSKDATNNSDGSLTFGKVEGLTTVSFNLSPPPCLTVLVTQLGKSQPAGCSGRGSGTITGTSGDTITVTSSNWIASDSSQIRVTLRTTPCNGGVSPTPTAGKTSTPKPKPTASPQKSSNSVNPTSSSWSDLLLGDTPTQGGHLPHSERLVQLKVSITQDGTLTATGSLPTVSSATIYNVCAVDMNHQEWAVPAKGSTTAGPQVKVLPPASSKLPKLLLLLGGLFSLVSLGVFVMTMPRRAAVPQPVGRRQ